MTIKIALTGKSGSGKTTLTKAFLSLIKEKYPDKTILLFDNDLTGELGHSFGHDIRNTIYGIRTGKHEYNTDIPGNMTKQEFIDWALEDIIVPLEDNVDIIVSWLSGVKDCRCPVTSQINYALKRLFNRYDFVIFDCEFDLKYLIQLVDVDVDLTLIVTTPHIESLKLSKRISEYSAKYSAGGQLGIVINKANNSDKPKLYEIAKETELDILGIIPIDENLINGSISKESDLVKNSLKEFYSRLNLPQENTK